MSKLKNISHYIYKDSRGNPVGCKDEIKHSVGVEDKDSVGYFLSHNKGKRPLTDEEIEANAYSEDYSDLYSLWVGGK